MSKPVVVDGAAAEELARSAAWYDREKPGLGSELTEAIETVLAALASGPLVSQPVGHGSNAMIRRILVERFPYAVLFAETETAFVVVAIAHLRRAPQFWHARVPKDG